MGTSISGERRVSIGQSTFVSVGLVTTLLIGAIYVGGKLKQIEVIEGRVSELRMEFNAHRDGTAHSQSVGR